MSASHSPSHQAASIDKLIAVFDMGLRTLCSQAVANRPCPQPSTETIPTLSDDERKHAAGLMRVNHVGEVCAQALYSGQALVSKNAHHVAALNAASREEVDHLAWCEDRITALGGRTSLLNPVWYAASFGMGVAAGLMGEKWNLGFLAETEHQVSAHLEGHLSALPEHDVASKAIVAQMKIDEEHHAETAKQLGAATLPAPLKSAMRLASAVMTHTAYRL